MTGNPLPWIVIASVLLVTLVIKGYVKLPSLGPVVPRNTGNPQSVANVDKIAPPPSDLSMYTSEDLGYAFAKAKRREAEEELARRIARDAGEAIRTTFTSPFSPPAPAGQDPNQAGVLPPA